jgi:hypothetical protein
MGSVSSKLQRPEGVISEKAISIEPLMEPCILHGGMAFAGRVAEPLPEKLFTLNAGSEPLNVAVKAVGHCGGAAAPEAVILADGAEDTDELTEAPAGGDMSVTKGRIRTDATARI